jgi:hypothetical protein
VKTATGSSYTVNVHWKSRVPELPLKKPSYALTWKYVKAANRAAARAPQKEIDKREREDALVGAGFQGVFKYSRSDRRVFVKVPRIIESVFFETQLTGRI